VGGYIGYSWGHTSTDYTTVDPAGPTVERNADSINMNGVIGGAQAGYNYRFQQNFLVGLEADIQASGEKGSNNPLICHSNAVAPFTGVCDFGTINDNYTEKLEWFGTVRARAGYLISPTWLVYATGGLAYGRLTRNDNYAYFAQFFCNSGGGAGGAGVCTPQSNSLSSTNTGWTVGAGVEAEITGHWTAKLEYLYMDLAGLGTQTFALTSGNPPLINLTTNSHHFTDNILRVGVNYRFGAGPLVAKY
jgi:outer membrane immunogenic protein